MIKNAERFEMLGRRGAAADELHTSLPTYA